MIRVVVITFASAARAWHLAA